MSVLGEVLGASVPHVFIDGERRYNVSLINQRVLSAFERDLFARSKEALRGMKDMYSEDEYQAKAHALHDQYLDGEFAFQSPRGRAAIKSTSGVLTLAAMLFGIDQASMMDLLLRRQKDVVDLIGVIIRESFPSVETPDPK